MLAVLADGPIGVTEVAERVDLPKSTAARMLTSLAREGAVEQVPGETRYRLGHRMAALAAGVRPVRNLGSIARPVLEDLAARFGEAAGLSVPDGDTAHYIDQVDTDHQVQIRDWTGTYLPMHAVSSGQIFLAYRPMAPLERFLASPLQRFTTRTLVEPALLRDRLRQVQLDGYAWVHDEFADGMSSVAAPIVDDAGEIVAAVHVHGPSFRFPGRDAERAAATAVVEGAGRISARIRPGPSPAADIALSRPG